MLSHHLFGYHDHRLRRKLSVAEVEEILKTGPKKVNDQNVVQTLLAKVVNVGYPRC